MHCHFRFRFRSPPLLATTPLRLDEGRLAEYGEEGGVSGEELHHLGVMVTGRVVQECDPGAPSAAVHVDPLASSSRMHPREPLRTAAWIGALLVPKRHNAPFLTSTPAPIRMARVDTRLCSQATYAGEAYLGLWSHPLSAPRASSRVTTASWPYMAASLRGV
jgi:hypothetical protein